MLFTYVDAGASKRLINTRTATGGGQVPSTTGWQTTRRAVSCLPSGEPKAQGITVLETQEQTGYLFEVPSSSEELQRAIAANRKIAEAEAILARLIDSTIEEGDSKADPEVTSS